MEKTDKRYRVYIDILNKELVPAQGCTEPIAVAYAAAKAREVLGEMPERVLLQVSGCIIKNVKSVIVPNTGHMKGLQAAVAAGIIAGKPELELEAISQATPQQIAEMQSYMQQIPIEIEHVENGHVFEIIVCVYAGEHNVRLHIEDEHTNIVSIEKDGETVYAKEQCAELSISDPRTLLSMEGIWDFALTVDLADVEHTLQRQISCNTAIAEEGLKGSYGANIGRVLLAAYGDSVAVRAKAKAAAGSDARMNGCEMPVIINSGSGNQGITCSVPVVEYAHELGASHEKLLRALVISNLTAIHEKTGIGTLSAYCGAVSAASGAGAGIVYLLGGSYDDMAATVSNALATVSGVVCDGAKASCAAKIAESLDAALLGYYMSKNGKVFQGGDGLVKEDIEETIRGIGRLGRDGMRSTNDEVIDIMLGR